MKITPIKTHKITTRDTNLSNLLTYYLPKKLPNNIIITVSSKVVSLCEGNFINKDDENKKSLVQKEADLVLGDQNPYRITITIKNNILLPTAGIDGYDLDGGIYILWPKNSQRTANTLRSHLMKKYKLKYIGVIITDSRSTVMRRGTIGFALAYSGFEGLKRNRHKATTNYADALAAAAAVVMGEGDEQTPIALITDIPFVTFVRNNPTKKELDEFSISTQRDLFIPAILAAKNKILRKK